MKKQYITALVGILGVGIIFFLGRTVDKSPKNIAVENTVKPFAIGSYIDSLKTTLTSSQSATLSKFESGLTSNDPIAKASYHQAAAEFWKDSLRLFEPYIHHLSEAAKLENSEKNLTFAAHLMLDNIRMQQDPAKLAWLTAETIDLFERAIKLNPTDDDLKIGLGSAYVFGKGRDGNAQATMEGIRTLLDVAERDSNNMKAQLVLGIGGMISGQFDKAQIRFLRIVEREPNNLEAIAYLADTYAAMGKKDEAIKWYNISKKLADNPHYSQEVDERIRQLR